MDWWYECGLVQQFLETTNINVKVLKKVEKNFQKNDVIIDAWYNDIYQHKHYDP
jgi:hypothetical protein